MLTDMSRCHKFTGSPDPFDRVAKINSRGFTVLWGKLGVGPKCCDGNVWLLGINVDGHVTLSQIYRVARSF